MKVSAILNNYQIGSYTFNCLSQKVVSKERIDSYHTKVIWDIDNTDLFLLSKIVGNPKRLKEVEK